MKAIYSLAVFLFILISFAGCSSEADSDLKANEEIVQSYESQLEANEEIIDSLQQQVADLQSENQVVSQELNDLKAELEALRLSPLGLDFMEDMNSRKYMTASDVVIRKAPMDSEEVKTGTNLSYIMVNTVYAIYAMGDEPLEDRTWILVQYASSEPEDTVGWVKWKELIEYTEENMHLLASPIYVSEEAIDLYTGETVDPLFCSGGWVEFEDDYAIVSVVGGKFCKVDKKYLIYPTP